MKKASRKKCALLAASALGVIASPAIAQRSTVGAQEPASANDIIVTARRTEERLQDVPISIAVINQQQIANNNIFSAKDLATYTPGLQINSRYGADSTNFSIRGFTQEQRTQATVGVYFADVVAPRGSGGTFGGDGAGPGSLFDLQNIQVLYGPQGTLQGRNVTGGAVLLVPKKPTGRFEGYIEGSLGDYSMRRVQAVVNVPIADNFRLRAGLDRMTRDGYLKNIGTLGDGIHPGKGMGDINYWAGRVSIVGDLTPNLENYAIATFSHSSSNGIIPKLSGCSQSVASQNFGVLTQARCQAQIAREASYGPWAVENRLPDSASIVEQWQVINTTTWNASDALTVKNIFAYGEYRQRTNLELFGNYYLANAAVDPSTVTSPGQVTGFAFTHANPVNHHTNAQSSLVEEFRIAGRALDERLTYQGGVYVEINQPLGYSGVQTATGTACVNIDTLNCPATPGFSLGSLNVQLSSTLFTDYAIYGQASYALTEKIKLTGGLRYTWDREASHIRIESISGATPTVATCANPTAPGFGTSFPSYQAFGQCTQFLEQKSHAPTWTAGVDYKPTDTILLYGKYSRGYRQGGLSLFGPDSVPPSTVNLQPYKQEKVDSYEIGAKTSWHGQVPGSFDISGFYNDFTNQQLLLGAVLGTRTNALVANAGKSRLFGLEATLNVSPMRGLHASVSYSYINTKLKSFIAPNLGAGVALTPPVVGLPIPNTEPHKVNVAIDYALPFIPAETGRISVGGVFVYTASYIATTAACPFAQSATNPAINTGCYDASNNGGTAATNPGFGLNNVNPNGSRLPGAATLNLNVNWDGAFGKPVDIAFFITNALNGVHYLTVNDNTARSFSSRLVAEPRMFGFRLKYRFGH